MPRQQLMRLTGPKKLITENKLLISPLLLMQIKPRVTRPLTTENLLKTKLRSPKSISLGLITEERKFIEREPPSKNIDVMLI